MTPDPTHRGHTHSIGHRDAFTLALVSAGILSFQITMMQVLATLVWFHFAYLIISFALLGFGISGTLLSNRRDGSSTAWIRWIPLLAASCALGMVAAAILPGGDRIPIDLYEAFSNPVLFISCGLYLLILLVPFTSGALVIALLLLSNPNQAGKTYAINLSATALGALGAPLFLDWMAPGNAVTVCAILPAIGALVSARRTEPVMVWATASVILAALAASLFPVHFKPSPYKDIARLLELPEASVIGRFPSDHGFVAVISAPAMRYHAPLSLEYASPTPAIQTITANGDAVGQALDPDSNLSDLFAHTPEGIVSQLIRPGPVWLLESGDILPVSGLNPDANRPILVVTPHPEVGRLITAQDKRVKLASIGPRSFLRGTPEFAAWIRFPSPTAPSGSIGLDALTEQPLFTREAFARAWERLGEGGLLTVTVPIDHPLRAAPRLIRTIYAGLQLAGIEDPCGAMVGIQTWSSLTFLLRRSGFTPGDLTSIRQFCETRGFDLIVSASLQIEVSEPFNTFADPADRARIRSLLAGENQPNPAPLFNEFPASDRRPYFSQFLRLSRAWEQLPHLGLRNLAYLELGLPVVFVTILAVSTPALILIALPLFGRRDRLPGRSLIGPAVRCGGALGLGFILVEIGLIQWGTALTGNPVTVAARIITVLLFSAGAGSLVTHRFGRSGFGPGIPAAATAAWVTVAFVMPFLVGDASGSYPISPFGILLGATAIAGLLMGMPFPRLLFVLGKTDRRTLPWAWGVNGFLSVIGAPLATLLSVWAGFPVLFLTAAGAYVLAAWSGRRLGKPVQRSVQA